jgi:AAA family ATP:ADP antiporter
MQPSSPADASNTLLRRMLSVRGEERASVVLAAACFFFVFAGYYMLRPIRDEIGAIGGGERLPWLFLGTLGATLALTPCSAGSSRHCRAHAWRRGRAEPSSHACAASSRCCATRVCARLGRAGVLRLGQRVQPVRGVAVVERDDRCVPRRTGATPVRHDRRGRHARRTRRRPADRLARGTHRRSAAAARFGCAARMRVALHARVECAHGSGGGRTVEHRERIGRRRRVRGIVHVARSPYLAGIAVFIALFTIGSTFLYSVQAQIVASTFADRAARIAWFANVDATVNAATLLLQLFVTGRLFARIGTTAMLCILPLVSIAGFATLAAAPVVAVLVVFQVARRTFDFALMRPARESLYVPLPREDKYKTKNVIDTFVYRGGDQFGIWAQGGLSAHGLGSSGIALVAMALAVAWLALAAWLGRAHAVCKRLPPLHPIDFASDSLQGERNAFESS